MVDKSQKFTWLVRLGFAARGLVYVLIGYLALASGRSDNGPEGVLAWMRDAPLGVPLLYVSALGLLGYALFRLSSLLFDLENHGTDGKGFAQRIGHGASGVGHLALAWIGFQMARGGSQPADGSGAREASGTLLSFSFGWIVLGLIGLGFLLAAAAQAEKAVTASFMRRVSSDAPSFVEYLGRGGYAARTAVFLIIAWSLVQSAWFGTERVKTLGEAIGSLAAQEPLYTLVAAGLLLFGLFSLLLARFRIVPELDRKDLRVSLG
jgi:hypothetical protein